MGKKGSKIGKILTHTAKKYILIWAIQSGQLLTFVFKSHLVYYFSLLEPQKAKKIRKKFIHQFLILSDFSIFHPNRVVHLLHSRLPILALSSAQYETNTQSQAYMWVKLGYRSSVPLGPTLGPTGHRLWLQQYLHRVNS